jgi:potassium channel
VYEKVEEGDMFGEVGALCDIPQPFTCRTTTLSQLLRIRRIRLTEIMQEHREDSKILMNNLFQVQLHCFKEVKYTSAKISAKLKFITFYVNEQKLKLHESLPELKQLDRRFMHKYELFHAPQEAWLLPQPYLQYTEHKLEDIGKKIPTFCGDHGSTKLAAETNQMRLTQQGNSHDHGDYMATDGMAGEEGERNEVHINYETKEVSIHINSEDCDAASHWQTDHETVRLGSSHNTSDGITMRENQDSSNIKSSNKRVTIHTYPHNAAGSLGQNGKLINLPGSLDEIFEIGCKEKFQDFGHDLVMRI